MMGLQKCFIAALCLLVVNNVSDVNANIDGCASSPCLNGGHCTDDVGQYTCHCVTGYIGPQCQLEVINSGRIAGSAGDTDTGHDAGDADGGHMASRAGKVDVGHIASRASGADGVNVAGSASGADTDINTSVANAKIGHMASNDGRMASNDGRMASSTGNANTGHMASNDGRMASSTGNANAGHMATNGDSMASSAGNANAGQMAINDDRMANSTGNADIGMIAHTGDRNGNGNVASNAGEVDIGPISRAASGTDHGLNLDVKPNVQRTDPGQEKEDPAKPVAKADHANIVPEVIRKTEGNNNEEYVTLAPMAVYGPENPTTNKTADEKSLVANWREALMYKQNVVLVIITSVGGFFLGAIVIGLLCALQHRKKKHHHHHHKDDK